MYMQVSLPSVEALWEAFNDLADGFGVAKFEFKEICAELSNELGLNRIKMDEKSSALFNIMDADKVSDYNQAPLLINRGLRSILYTEWPCGRDRVHKHPGSCFRHEDPPDSGM